MAGIPSPERVRAAELIAATSLATDLGMGLPFEHGLQSTLVAVRLADRLGVHNDTVTQVYFACLLAHAGCTTDAREMAEMFGGSLTTNLQPRLYGSVRDVMAGLIRAIPDPESSPVTKALDTVRKLPRVAQGQKMHLTALCEVAGMLAAATDMPSPIQEALLHLTERWDGRGLVRHARGDEIPLPIRIVHVALDANLQCSLHGADYAASLIREHADHALDPEIAGCFADGATEILAVGDQESAWDETLDREPNPPLFLEGQQIDQTLRAMGNFADLVSPFFTGHSVGVAETVAAAAGRCRLDKADTTAVTRAALIHDVGRVAIGVRIWEKAGPLNADEWERVRLHPYHIQRVLSRSEFLAPLALLAGAHHERLNGSGYHRGASARDLPVAARLLAAADAYHAMTEPRPHREAMSPGRAAETLAREAKDGRLDADAVTAVVEGAGQSAPRLERPAGLTEREAEVVAMLARGLQTKQVARRLGISVKTADRHIQNAYRKIGVSTRAAATLFSMEHGLVAWGELPIARRTSHP
jgi:HD-GYP domain-containing protein (c-di-GMP phosphodiesterase class II)